MPAGADTGGVVMVEIDLPPRGDAGSLPRGPLNGLERRLVPGVRQWRWFIDRLVPQAPHVILVSHFDELARAWPVDPLEAGWFVAGEFAQDRQDRLDRGPGLWHRPLRQHPADGLPTGRAS